MNSKLTAEGIMGAAMRMGAELSGGEFPISVFPHKIQRIITELHASQGYPVDYIAAAMLSALAVSIGNSHLAQVKRGWVESPILYICRCHIVTASNFAVTLHLYKHRYFTCVEILWR